MPERRGRMGSVGAERMRVMREGAPADVQGRQVSGLALRNGGEDEEREKERWIQAALRRKTWQGWAIRHWEVRGREEQA